MGKEEWLSNFSISTYTSGHGESSGHITFWPTYGDRRDLEELIHLARLGLWAEEHGVPLLREFEDEKNDGGCEGWVGNRSAAALASLPPEPLTSDGEEKV